MKDKILQNEIDNFDKLHSEMLHKVEFVQTLENLIKQTSWQTKFMIMETTKVLSK